MVKHIRIYIWLFLGRASLLAIVAIHDNKVIPVGTKIKRTGDSTIDAVGGTCTDSAGARERIFSLLSHFSKCLSLQ
jgi:hypothetical protein